MDIRVIQVMLGHKKLDYVRCRPMSRNAFPPSRREWSHMSAASGSGSLRDAD